MRIDRIAAGIVAAAVLASSVGFAVVNNDGSEQPAENQNVQAQHAKQTEGAEEYSYEYGIVQSLWFKINELWRLSINSDLGAETTNAISALNNGFDSDLLMKAIKAEGSEAIDEYIYSVLAGIDFELYLSDKDGYEQAKSETGYDGEILTEEKIEEYLNQLNEETAKAQVNEAVNPSPVVPNQNPSYIPQVPTAESVLPENPADAVKRETQAITDKAMGIGEER